MDATLKTEVVKNLTTLRELLGDKSRWTRGSNARDPNDAPVSWDHPGACKWCMNGALLKVSGHKRGEDYPKAYDKAESMLSTCAINLFEIGYVTVNDGRGYAEVVAVMDCALKCAQDEPVTE